MNRSGPSRSALRIAQLLLMIAALGLWVASGCRGCRFAPLTDSGGADQDLNGAAWSNALLPLALLLLAAALAGAAVRGLWLRLVAVLVAGTCLALGYLGVSLFITRTSARAARPWPGFRSSRWCTAKASPDRCGHHPDRRVRRTGGRGPDDACRRGRGPSLGGFGPSGFGHSGFGPGGCRI